MAMVPQSLERALGVLVCTFQRYCRKDGERHTLSRKQLKALLEEELPSLRCLRRRDSTLEELMATLDKDRDGQVSFPEFVRFVAATCTFFHDFFRDRSTALPPKVSILDGARPPEPEEEEGEVEEEKEGEKEGEVEEEVEKEKEVEEEKEGEGEEEKEGEGKEEEKEESQEGEGHILAERPL